MKALFAAFFIVMSLSSVAQPLLYPPDTIALEHTKDNSIRVAFGSCFKQSKPSTIFYGISNQSPDLWIWLGDNIYGDSENIDTLQSKYNQVKSDSAYQFLIQKGTLPVIGTWDDHDYGRNDAGKEWPIKKESAQLALDFLEVPNNSPRRKHEGIYGAYYVEWNTKETAEKSSILFVMLDTRYFRDSLGDRKGTVLGEEQWKWLKSTLKASQKSHIVICSSIQVIPNDHQWERWGNFPKERMRLFKLLKKHAPNAIILSGDRHRAEYSRYHDKQLNLLEITSSSLNAPGSCVDEQNQHRAGDVVCGMPNFGMLIFKHWKSGGITAELHSFTQSSSGEGAEKINWVKLSEIKP